MNELPSTEFRKTFPRLAESTTVTVNGHPIGTWLPGIDDETVRLLVTELGHRGIFPSHLKAAQAQRDELLRKINRSK